MFKFISNDSSGFAPKRQQVQRACEPCRKRKKRCDHTRSTSPLSSHATLEESPIGDRSSPQQQSHLLTPGRSSSQDLSGMSTSGARDEDQGSNHTYSLPQSTNRPVAPALPTLSEIENQKGEAERRTRDGNWAQAVTTHRAGIHESRSSRFIGDLSPEGMFLAATSPDTTRGVAMDDSVGVWLNTRFSRRTSMISPPPRLDPSPANLFYASESSLVQKVLMPMLEQECLTTLPSPARCQALSKIYFEKIHPLFPVIDEVAYHEFHSTDPRRILLQQSICLAASKAFASRNYLVLSDSGPLCSCREFGDKLSGAIRLSIEMGLITNKIVLIQVLALMLQFADWPDGGDLSSQLCARVVHYTQSIGLQHRGQQEDGEDQYSVTLFSCIWAIDRMNAAFNGRPVLMHERDFSKNLEQGFERQEPAFRLYLRIIQQLDKVIELYRPSGESDLDQNFPSFEDIVMNCGASHIGSSSLATIEALYHAVAMLSCRSKGSANPPRSYPRQNMSAASLSSTVSRELHDQLILFRFVPYAMSLAMSVAYREIRNTRVPLYRTRALAQFRMIHEVLSELESTYWSAATTAEMGKKMLKEMSRVSTVVTASESQKPPQDSSIDMLNTISIVDPVAAAETSSTEDPNPNHMVLEDLDLSFFDSIGDVDLFGMFDPAFDLEGFDACLEGNLNVSFPNHLF